MKPNRTTTGLLLLVVMAAMGFLLVYMPGKLVEQYQLVREAGPVWITVYFSVVGAGAVILLGLTLWILGRLWWRSRAKVARRQRRDKNPSELSAEAKRLEIDENLASVSDYQDEAASAELRRELAPLIRQLEQKREEQTLEIVAFGTVSSGKSSLLNALAGRDVFVTDARGGTTLQRNEIPWPGIDHVLLVDTPGLGEVHGAEHAEVSADAAENADLVLLVVDGPLRDSEFQLLRRLFDMEKRVLLCLNKEDWYEVGREAAAVGPADQPGERADRRARCRGRSLVAGQATTRASVARRPGSGRAGRCPARHLGVGPADDGCRRAERAGSAVGESAAAVAWPGRNGAARVSKRRSTSALGSWSIATCGVPAERLRSARCRCSIWPPAVPCR